MQYLFNHQLYNVAMDLFSTKQKSAGSGHKKQKHFVSCQAWITSSMVNSFWGHIFQRKNSRRTLPLRASPPSTTTRPSSLGDKITTLWLASGRGRRYGRTTSPPWLGRSWMTCGQNLWHCLRQDPAPEWQRCRYGSRWRRAWKKLLSWNIINC